MNADPEISGPSRVAREAELKAAPGSSAPVERRASWADAQMGARFVLSCLGLLFVTFGLAGFIAPRLLGTYLTPERCWFNLGCAAFMFQAARVRSHHRARLGALMLMLLFGGLAAAGFIAGNPGVRTIGMAEPDPRLVRLFDGRVELGRNDHSMHLVLASLFLYAALAPKSWDQD